MKHPSRVTDHMHIRPNFGRFSKGKRAKFCTVCSHNCYIAFFVSRKYLGNWVNVFLRIHNGDCHSVRLFKNMIVSRKNAVFGKRETRSTPRVPMGATSAFIQPGNNECGRLAQFVKALGIKDKGSGPAKSAETSPQAGSSWTRRAGRARSFDCNLEAVKVKADYDVSKAVIDHICS